MNLITLLIDVLLTIPLSFIMMRILNKKNNFLYACIIPTIYIIVISSIIPSIKENIFIIPIVEVFIRNFYITNINEEIINNKRILLSSLLSIVLAILTYNYFISKVSTVLPTPEEIRPFLWLIIIFVIYSLLKDNDIKNISNIKSLQGKNEYILMQYAKYKSRYNEIVNSKSKTINTLIYSLMIYKTYQQPRLIKNIKNYIRHLLNKEVKYGILEVSSPTPISDEESITKTIKDLESITKKKKETVEQYLTKYNEEEQKEIVNIFNVINNF